MRALWLARTGGGNHLRAMRRRLLLVLAVILAALLAWLRWKSTPVTPPTQTEDRVALARARCGAKVMQLCASAGVSYPPHELFLRAFKSERELEAWGRSDDGPLRLLATWPVLAASGELGPKRREGDRQVPEGCYLVAVFNPLSNYHLSLGLDYPNASDRVRADPQAPGSDIYIHGSAVSIGCLALGDDAIEELYVLASDTREQPIAVHIFPARMSGPAWENLRATHPEHAAFWAELAPIHAAFERAHAVPLVEVETNGRYRLKERSEPR